MPISSFICNTNNMTSEINERILARNLAYGNLDVLLSDRPTPTKYVLPYTVVDPPCHRKILHYNLPTFNPGNRKGTWSGYVTNINDESILKNQLYALQKFPQAEFVPNSNSDLYNSSIPTSNKNVELLFPNLFNSNIVNSNNLGTPVNLQNSGNYLFNNDTRQQLKDS